MTVGNMEGAQLFQAGAKGRGLRATRDLSPGDVVFSEASFSAVVFDSLAAQVCHGCFRRQPKLHRCGQCSFAHYCDRTCQTASWSEHKQECGAIRRLQRFPSQSVRLAARVLWRIHKDTGLASDTQLVPVDQLEDHVSDLAQEDLEKLRSDVKDLQKFWSHGRKKISSDYIALILGIIKCNGFTLSDQRGLQAVGVGLFPNLCLVNHDCWPNCSVVLNHGNQSALSSALHSQRRIELRALENISAGAELTVSYVDFLSVSSERQKKLKDHFHFDCTCEHCSLKLKDHLMTSTVGDASQVKEVTAFTEESLEKIERFRGDGEFLEVVQLSRQCLQKQEKVLDDTHLLKLQVLSAASEVLSYIRCFTEAAEFSRRMVEGYKKLHHHNSAQLGLAIMRAGVTHWHAGQIEAGHLLICEAFSILMVTHGPNHSITRDLEEMRSQTEQELKMFRQDQASYKKMREAALK